jgi:ABC-type phosphate transport system auxiliary subunit
MARDWPLEREDYVEQYPDAMAEFVRESASALSKLERSVQLEVQGLDRCNRIALREIGKLEDELERYRSDAPRDQLIQEHNALKVEVERLKAENAKLVLDLSGTREQLKALAAVVG